MSLATLERAITEEARSILNNRKLRVKDMQEWSTGEVKPQEGEIVIFCPTIGAYAAFKKECDKRKAS